MPFTLSGEISRVTRNNFRLGGFLAITSVLLSGIPVFISGRYEAELLYFFVPSVLLMIPAIWALYRGYKWNSRPEKHPLNAKVRSIGFGAETAINTDLLQAQDFLRLRLGREWILRRGTYDLQLEAVSDAVWAYDQENHSEYVLYTRAVVCLRTGGTICSDFSAKAKPVHEFLDAFSKTAPWVILGENAGLHKLWKKDRAGFVAQVDNRRKILEKK